MSPKVTNIAYWVNIGFVFANLILFWVAAMLNNRGVQALALLNMALFGVAAYANSKSRP
jgi:hypothetical protein